MDKWRKLLCFLFGHRSICLFRYHWGIEPGDGGSMSTGWICERCGHTKFEQWDT